MAYDEDLAERMREVLSGQPGVDERKMFGGLAFMVNGHMACGIVGDELMVRVGPERQQDVLSLPHAREMTFTGKSMKSMVYVSRDGFASDEDLAAWMARGVDFARSLPVKGAGTGGK